MRAFRMMAFLTASLSCVACGEAFTAGSGAAGSGAAGSGAGGTGAAGSGAGGTGAGGEGGARNTSCEAKSALGCWFSEDFDSRRAIVVEHKLVSRNHAHFPIFVHIQNAPDLFEKGRDDGADFVFTDAKGVQLPHEVETWCNRIGGMCTAPELGVWVAADLAGGADTKLYFYYGGPAQDGGPKPSDVWDAGYAAVWHLSNAREDSPVGDCKKGDFGCDATAKGNHAAKKGGLAETAQIKGQLSAAVDFSGGNHWLEALNSESLNIAGDTLTLTAWVRLASNQNNDPGLVVKSDDHDYNYQLVSGGRPDGTRASDFRVRPEGKSYALVNGPGANQTKTWYLFAGSYDGAIIKAFTNGQLGGAQGVTGGIAATSEPVVIGRRALTDNRFFDGAIDEVRISNVARSDGWLMTSYQNQSAPQTFAKLGEPEPRP